MDRHDAVLAHVPPPSTAVASIISLPNSLPHNLGFYNSSITRLFLFAASSKPARDAALGLCGAVLDLSVKLVNGFQGFAFGVLGVGFCVALELAGFSVGIGPLGKNGQLICSIWVFE